MPIDEVRAAKETTQKHPRRRSSQILEQHNHIMNFRVDVSRPHVYKQTFFSQLVSYHQTTRPPDHQITSPPPSKQGQHAAVSYNEQLEHVSDKPLQAKRTCVRMIANASHRIWSTRGYVYRQGSSMPAHQQTLLPSTR